MMDEMRESRWKVVCGAVCVGLSNVMSGWRLAEFHLHFSRFNIICQCGSMIFNSTYCKQAVPRQMRCMHSSS